MIHIHVGKGAGDRIISNREGRIFQFVVFFFYFFFLLFRGDVISRMRLFLNSVRKTVFFKFVFVEHVKFGRATNRYHKP